MVNDQSFSKVLGILTSTLYLILCRNPDRSPILWVRCSSDQIPYGEIEVSENVPKDTFLCMSSHTIKCPLIHLLLESWMGTAKHSWRLSLMRKPTTLMLFLSFPFIRCSLQLTQAPSKSYQSIAFLFIPFSWVLVSQLVSFPLSTKAN